MADSQHPGKANIHHLFDSFELRGTQDQHQVLVFQPAQMSLRDMKLFFCKDGFDRAGIIELLHGHGFLHREAEVIHTGK
jgi:serine/threonine-protein kinase SRPK3